MGVVVNEMTIDTRIAAESVIANSRNRRPMMPPINSSGINTAIRETLIEKTVKPTTGRLCSAACTGVSPSSRCRVMFSITTIASSTTNPLAMASAISDKLSSE